MEHKRCSNRVQFAIKLPTDSCLLNPGEDLNTKCVPVGYKLTYRFLPTYILSIEAVPALHLDPLDPFTHSQPRVATTFQLMWLVNPNTLCVRNTKGVLCFARITSCACRPFQANKLAHLCLNTIIGGRLTEPSSILTETRSEQLTE